MAVPNESNSVTRWFVRLQAGDEEAARLLWGRYFPRLMALAGQRFAADRNPVYGADDVAQSVFHLLCRGARQGRYANVASRDQLWRLLVSATRNKIIDRTRYHRAAKRGGGEVQHLGDDIAMDTDMPTPQTLIIMQEQLSLLLTQLRDDTFRIIAMRRLEGFTNSEIAKELDVSERTIERKLNLIRGDWEKAISTAKN